MIIVRSGLDGVEGGKLRELLAPQQTFEERVFTLAERDDCAARADKAEALAARFAAKEACFKALGTGWSQGVSFLQVEVQRGDGGAPRLALSGGRAGRGRGRGGTNRKLSLRTGAGAVAAAGIPEG